MAEVEVRRVTTESIAAVRRRIPQSAIAAGWRPALDLVWTFLRAHPGLHAGGHNVFVYRGMGIPGLLDVDFGVQVTRPFEGEGDVTCAFTPQGEAATLLHTGSYDRLAESYAALRAWFAEQGQAMTGDSWEVYGDWTDDPARLETRLFWLLH